MTIRNVNSSCGTAVKPSCTKWKTPRTPLLKSAWVACSACPVTNANVNEKTFFNSHSILSWILIILKAVTFENISVDKGH